MAAQFKTKLSTKGQVILPKAARDRKGWTAGCALVVEERPDGLLIRKERLFPETRLEDVAGMLKYDGPPISIEDMADGRSTSPGEPLTVVDTNVVIRFLTADNPSQFRVASDLVGAGVFVPLTVMLEAAWVLRSNYDHSEVEAVRALDRMAGLPGVEIEHPDRFYKAVGWVRSGMEFADALHLAAAQDGEGFATFDRNLAKVAAREGVKTVELLS